MANDKWCADARQLLIEIERIYEDHYSQSYDQCVHDIFNAMRRIVKRNATFRTVEVVHGRWEMLGDNYANCTNCGNIFETLPTPMFFKANNKYCRKCGAKMDGDGSGT